MYQWSLPGTGTGSTSSTPLVLWVKETFHTAHTRQSDSLRGRFVQESPMRRSPVLKLHPNTNPGSFCRPNTKPGNAHTPNTNPGNARRRGTSTGSSRTPNTNRANGRRPLQTQHKSRQRPQTQDQSRQFPLTQQKSRQRPQSRPSVAEVAQQSVTLSAAIPSSQTAIMLSSSKDARMNLALVP